MPGKNHTMKYINSSEQTLTNFDALQNSKRQEVQIKTKNVSTNKLTKTKIHVWKESTKSFDTFIYIYSHVQNEVYFFQRQTLWHYLLWPSPYI